MEDLLTVDEVATMARVPIATVYAWRYQGRGPVGFKVGRYVRFRRADVELWLAQLQAAGRTG